MIEIFMLYLNVPSQINFLQLSNLQTRENTFWIALKCY